MKTETRQIDQVTDAGYVFPAPPRATGELIVTRDRLADPQRATATTARAFGTRMQSQAESLELLFGELRSRIDVLDASIADASAAQLKGAVRQLGEVLEWCEAVQQDLRDEAAAAVAGREPVDLGELCRRQAANAALTVAIDVCADDDVVCWAGRAECAVLIDRAIALVHARGGAAAPIRVDVSWQDQAACVAIRGLGDAVVDELPEGLAEAFRSMADFVGATVTPDDRGPRVAGLALRLPV